MTIDDLNDYITSDETNDIYPDNNKIKLTVGDVFIFLVKLLATIDTIVKYILQLQEAINLVKTL